MVLMSRGFNTATTLFTNETASLANAAEIDTGFINVAGVKGLLVDIDADAVGLTIIQTNRLSDGGSESATTIPLPSSLNNVPLQFPARAIETRFQLQNNTGSAVTNVKFFVKSTEVQPTITPLVFSPLPQSQAILTQSVLIGQDTDNNFQNTRVNQVGALLVSDFGTEVQRGLFDGYEIDTKFGRNPDIDTGSAPEDMWNGSTAYSGFNATANENLETFSADNDDRGSLVSSGTVTGASTTTIVDSSATFITDGVAVDDVVLDDTKSIHGYITAVTSETVLTVERWSDGGVVGLLPDIGDSYRVATSIDTGAAVVKWVDPLNANYERQTSPYVIMNGTTGVTTTGDFFRLSRGRVILAGSSGRNEGVITARQATTTANIFAQMPTFGQTTIGCFTIPTGKICIAKRLGIGIVRANGSAGSATISLNVREAGGAFNAKRVYEVSTSTRIMETFVGGIVIRPKSDVKFTIDDVSDNNTVADAELEYFLIDEA